MLAATSPCRRLRRSDHRNVWHCLNKEAWAKITIMYHPEPQKGAKMAPLWGHLERPAEFHFLVFAERVVAVSYLFCHY
jgi:hypothetical protein